MTIYDARLQTRRCRNPYPSTMSQPLIIHHPALPCPRGVSPMDERLAQTCFSLDLLGRRKPLNLYCPNLNPQSPIPKIQPELSHLLPNTTTTPTKQINPLTTSPYHLTNPQATKYPLSPNLHNPRTFPATYPPHSLTLSSPSLTLSSLLSHTTTQTTGNSKSETMPTLPHHHKFTEL